MNPVIDMVDNLLKNGIKAVPKMMVGERTDFVTSLMHVSEYRINQETVTAPCGGLTTQHGKVQRSYEIAQFGSLIGFLASSGPGQSDQLFERLMKVGHGKSLQPCSCGFLHPCMQRRIQTDFQNRVRNRS